MPPAPSPATEATGVRSPMNSLPLSVSGRKLIRRPHQRHSAGSQSRLRVSAGHPGTFPIGRPALTALPLFWRRPSGASALLLGSPGRRPRPRRCARGPPRPHTVPVSSRAPVRKPWHRAGARPHRSTPCSLGFQRESPRLSGEEPGAGRCGTAHATTGVRAL